MSSNAVTLRDVARLAEVSEITVSRVLRGSGPIRAATRDRVLEAVRRTGYVQNRLAGTLASSSSNLVGVVLPSLSNNVFPEVMAGINAALVRSGYQPVVGVTDYDAKAEEHLVRSILAWKPAAMILTGLQHSRETVRLVERAGIRVIEIMDVGGRPIDVAIGLSHYAAGMATAKHLLARGYRRFGFVGHDIKRDHRAGQRLQGLIEWLVETGMAPPRIQLSNGASSILAGRAGLQSLLANYPECEVVVFANDDLAVGGVYHCLAAGITLRDQLGIFGFNGLDIAQALPQPLSTIRSNRALIGQIAVETFLQSSTPEPEGRVIDTGFDIIAGETA
ncbi:LacI family DNA-binding transcriptional regulator [Devosia naphthalenivorans]|uniref:LacI family DNA-binding transcriptional regulator n=1 Tax=Devosia naphthalenivorans TaxID=2082392 RepID=UPI0013B0656E|nr:LacI family DNA-binding transcriptional regulator [Devosia naphthalenivorans]